MSAISSVAIISSLAVLIGKPLRSVGSRFHEVANARAKELGEATVRALQIADSSAQIITEMPSLPNAFVEMDACEHRAMMKLRGAGEKLSAIDAQKAATIAAVLSAPVVAQNTQRVQAALEAVECARDRTQLATARDVLRQVIQSEHGVAWLDGLKDATERAFEVIGFRPTGVTARSAREIHLTAINNVGKVLVSELRLATDGTPSMATEVVNGCGPECDAILADFEKALSEYVRGTPPVRKPTGGVCQLEAAVDFVRRRVRRPPLQNAGAAKTRKMKTVVQKS